MAGILDARADEATRRFDAELATTASGGVVSQAAAQRLQTWQRASVREVAEHVRTVLPACLRALASAHREALEYADEAAEQFTGLSASPEESIFPFPAASPVAADGTVTGDTEVHRASSVPSRHPVQAGPDARRASPAATGQPSTLGERRPRLLVADLRDTQEDGAN